MPFSQTIFHKIEKLQKTNWVEPIELELKLSNELKEY